jgi:hypothetical protein
VFSAKKITESVHDLKNMIFTSVSEKKEEASVEGENDFTSFIPSRESINSQIELIKREKTAANELDAVSNATLPDNDIDLIKHLLVEQVCLLVIVYLCLLRCLFVCFFLGIKLPESL